MKVETLTGDALAAALDDVARLRIEVFRAWPYLYDGSVEYERGYLQAYRESAGAIVVGAFDGDTLVGAATGTPMEDHAGDFAAAFAPTGLDLETIFYCAESVLLPEYRGRGLGHAFFDAREDHARRLGRSHAAFCSVQRPEDHPLRPEGYVPLNGFWRKRGYAPLPGVVASFRWKDIDEAAETDHHLQFWLREL
ncbi:GNAT family N-acetyltransferase [Roseivivax sediminis]|uniref:Acetyltransferase (GNAT) family protein n=1 Tax=Roseivivax sediminis TaxID=936889 RepID=A0A1I1W8S1_9RHOB|nr:GNAT family N-acetyltransferase [Roseivivax sediminis]SFD91502.1 Acetyltransferase (GNAT) family protein [Roseivivax sediminis]